MNNDTEYNDTEFFRAYLECALWSSTDDDGIPLDRHDNLELSDELRELMTLECRLFEIKVGPFYRDHMTDTQAAHNFWLSRNGHGTGFWDMFELSQYTRDVLTGKAKAFGECDLYIGDDGKLYAN